MVFKNESVETGAIGNVPRTPVPGFDREQTLVNDIPVKDLRTTDTQTETEIDRDVLDALFANDVKFQIYLDQLKTSNNILRDQLGSQNQQIGSMTLQTYTVFRHLLESIGINPETIPEHPNPDFMIRTLKAVKDASPVALKETANMISMLQNLKRVTEVESKGTQVSPSWRTAKPSPINTKNLYPSVPNLDEVPTTGPCYRNLLLSSIPLLERSMKWVVTR
ncbi:hypothetical protein DFS34DRAFT_608814 [Phlyctochytrium arcticum]|nr:hypothetical protein DFS34DRAFT_608814 [Phlyctochytrium arcticum]